MCRILRATHGVSFILPSPPRVGPLTTLCRLTDVQLDTTRCFGLDLSRCPELDKSRCIELGESRCTELTNQVSVQMFRRWPGHLVTKSTQVWNWFTVNYFPENLTFYTFWKNPAIKLLTWQSTEQLPLTTPRVAPFPVLAFPMGDKSRAGFEKLPPSVVSQIQIRDIALKCWRTYASTNFLQKHFHIFNAICGIHGSSVHITNDLCSTTTTFSDNYFY